MNDSVEERARRNILAASERDMARRRQRDAEPVVPMRWRYRDGTWQRWSDLDRSFVPMQPPGTLVEHVAAHGEPVEDQELLFDGDSWEIADDLAEEAAAADPPEPPGSEAPTPPAPPPPLPPPPPAATDGEREAASFEAQLEAWRRRR